jgi:transposase-like protein
MTVRYEFTCPHCKSLSYVTWIPHRNQRVLCHDCHQKERRLKEQGLTLLDLKDIFAANQKLTWHHINHPKKQGN